MKRIKENEENVKTFTDFTYKSWFVDGDKIRVGDGLSDIMGTDFIIIELKEMFYGSPSKTWLIVADKEDKLYLLKTSKEFK
jgi:hypothetical protein